MRIYLSGPMAGQPHAGIAAFNKVAKLVREIGHVPVMPQDLPPWSHEGECPPAYSEGNGHSAACWMRSDLAAMLQCDAVLMLGAWHNSVGAQREHSVACWTGMPVYVSVNALPDGRDLAQKLGFTGLTKDQLREATRLSAQEIKGILASVILSNQPPTDAGAVTEGDMDFAGEMENNRRSRSTPVSAETRDERKKLYEINQRAEKAENFAREMTARIESHGQRVMSRHSVASAGNGQKEGMKYMLDAIVGYLSGERL